MPLAMMLVAVLVAMLVAMRTSLFECRFDPVFCLEVPGRLSCWHVSFSSPVWLRWCFDSRRAGMIELGTQVGSGTFGRVYLARRRAKPDVRWTTVAVKFPRSGDVEEIRAEYDMMRVCVHPGIIAVKEFLEGDGLQQLLSHVRKLNAAMVMEAAFSDLASFLQDQGPCFDAGLAQEWSRNLASALANLHRKGIIHRDLKPQNLLLCLDASSSRPGGHMKIMLKLTDFGSARHLPQDDNKRLRLVGKRPCFLNSNASINTEFSMTPGVCTAWYRAPELLSESATANRLDKPAETITGTIAYGAAMDVWSYGVVLYEMLSGGQQLARAWSGAGVLRCLLQKLEACPYAYFDIANPDVPRYMTTAAWKSMYDRANATSVDRSPLPKGGGWDVVEACLRWCPRKRPCMPEVLRLPWLAEETRDLPGGSVRTSSTDTVAAQVVAESGASTSTPGGVSLPPQPVWTPDARAQRYKQTPVLQLARDYSGGKCVERSGGVCQCKGHCRIWTHRRDGKCTEKMLVKGAMFCILCLCKVYGCLRGKNKGDMCSQHSRIFGKLPVHAQLAVLAADCASSLMPCDVVDFLQCYDTFKSDLAMCIIFALVKEPTATHLILEGWRRLPADYDADQMRCLLESVA